MFSKVPLQHLARFAVDEGSQRIRCNGLIDLLRGWKVTFWQSRKLKGCASFIHLSSPFPEWFTNVVGIAAEDDAMITKKSHNRCGNSPY